MTERDREPEPEPARGERRRGQIAAERSRFDLGPHATVIGDALGEPPPGYHLTFLRLFARDSRTLVAVWDVNDPAAVQAGERFGWSGLSLVLADERGAVLARVRLGARSGTYRLRAPGDAATLSGELRLVGEDHAPRVVARSHPVRVPPSSPAPGEEEPAPEVLALPPGTSLDRCVAAEPPPLRGVRPVPPGTRPAQRLHERLRLAPLVPRPVRRRPKAMPGPALPGATEAGMADGAQEAGGPAAPPAPPRAPEAPEVPAPRPIEPAPPAPGSRWPSPPGASKPPRR